MDVLLRRHLPNLDAVEPAVLPSLYKEQQSQLLDPLEHVEFRLARLDVVLGRASAASAGRASARRVLTELQTWDFF